MSYRNGFIFAIYLLGFVYISSGKIDRVPARTSIFYLGDSTSEKIYLYGLTKLLKCEREDPNIEVTVEANNKTGLLCYPNSARGYVRIGYMRHWGVGEMTEKSQDSIF